MKHDKSKIFLRLDNKTSEEIKEVGRVLEASGDDVYYETILFLRDGELRDDYMFLHYTIKNIWKRDSEHFNKTEISLQDFKELFASEEDNNGWIKIESEEDIKMWNEEMWVAHKDGDILTLFANKKLIVRCTMLLRLKPPSNPSSQRLKVRFIGT